MTPEVAKNVHRDFLQDTIAEYANERIKELKDELEYAPSFDKVREIQGQLREVRYLLKAREYAEAVLKKGK